MFRMNIYSREMLFSKKNLMIINFFNAFADQKKEAELLQALPLKADS